MTRITEEQVQAGAEYIERVASGIPPEEAARVESFARMTDRALMEIMVKNDVTWADRPLLAVLGGTLVNALADLLQEMAGRIAPDVEQMREWVDMDGEWFDVLLFRLGNGRVEAVNLLSLMCSLITEEDEQTLTAEWVNVLTYLAAAADLITTVGAQGERLDHDPQDPDALTPNESANAVALTAMHDDTEYLVYNTLHLFQHNTLRATVARISVGQRLALDPKGRALPAEEFTKALNKEHKEVVKRRFGSVRLITEAL